MSQKGQTHFKNIAAFAGLIFLSFMITFFESNSTAISQRFEPR